MILDDLSFESLSKNGIGSTTDLLFFDNELVLLLFLFFPEGEDARLREGIGAFWHPFGARLAPSWRPFGTQLAPSWRACSWFISQITVSV